MGTENRKGKKSPRLEEEPKKKKKKTVGKGVKRYEPGTFVGIRSACKKSPIIGSEKGILK